MRDYHLDINNPEFVYDPYPLLAELRDTLPAFFDPVWEKVFFTRYEDIAALLRDRRPGPSILHILSRDEFGWPPPNPLTLDFDRVQDDHTLDKEAPKHTQLRKLMAEAFTAFRGQRLRGKILGDGGRV